MIATRSTTASPRSEREEKLQNCVRRILQSEGVPPFREHANEVIARTLNTEGSCAQLARIVLKDLGLASQILRLANSATYNRSGRPISSVAHSITLLGWDTVRSLVGTLKYIEHFAGRSPGLRELMITSLLSAFHGRDIAVSLGYPSPEDAYIACLFRGLGEVLIARHFPKEYSEILLTMHEEKVPGVTASTRVLGFPWDEAGLHIAESWHLPPKVALCLSPKGRTAPSPLDRCLASIADYGHALTKSLYRDGAPLDSVQLRPILDPAGQRSLISVRDLHRIIDSARSDTEAILSVLQMSSDSLRLNKQAEHARYALRSTVVFEAANLHALDQAVHHATQQVMGGQFELSTMVVTLTDQVNAAGFDRVVFGLVNEDRTRIRGRLGSGDNIATVLEGFELPMDRSDGLLLALRRRTDVVVDRSLDDRYDETRIVRALDPTVFLLLPIVVNGDLVGFFYADCQRPVTGIEKARGACTRVRDVITQAIRRKAPSRHEAASFERDFD